MKAILIAMLILVAFAVSTFAAHPASGSDATSSDNTNCRLAVRTTFKNGKKKLEMLDVSANSREECRRKAKKREIVAGTKDIQRVRVSFGWRDPAQKAD